MSKKPKKGKRRKSKPGYDAKRMRTPTPKTMDEFLNYAEDNIAAQMEKVEARLSGLSRQEQLLFFHVLERLLAEGVSNEHS